MPDSEQTQPLFSTSLRDCFSVERLNAYGIGADTDFDKILRYSWNLKLCESLYVPLQNFEISLRNMIDVECKKGLGMPNWLSHSSMEAIERVAIQDAKDALEKDGKSISHAGIISELKFSFWTSLFRPVYEPAFYRKALINVFKHAPKDFRQRKPIHIKLDNIRKLRNRIFHHEPIWSDRDIQNKHNTILEMMLWMDPGMFYYTRKLDKFNTVYSEGISQFDREQLLAIACEE